MVNLVAALAKARFPQVPPVQSQLPFHVTYDPHYQLLQRLAPPSHTTRLCHTDWMNLTFLRLPVLELGRVALKSDKAVSYTYHCDQKVYD